MKSWTVSRSTVSGGKGKVVCSLHFVLNKWIRIHNSLRIPDVYRFNNLNFKLSFLYYYYYYYYYHRHHHHCYLSSPLCNIFIYNYTPEANHVSRVCNFVDILILQFTVSGVPFPMKISFFDISTFRSMFALRTMAVIMMMMIIIINIIIIITVKQSFSSVLLHEVSKNKRN